MLATCNPDSITSVATSALILGQLVTGHFTNVHHILGLSLEFVISSATVIIDIGAIWDISTINLMLLCELDPVTALGIVYITYLDHYYHWFERAALLDLLRYGAVGCVVYRMFWPWIHRTVVTNEFGGLHSRIGELYGCHGHASLQSPTGYVLYLGLGLSPIAATTAPAASGRHPGCAGRADITSARSRCVFVMLPDFICTCLNFGGPQRTLTSRI